MRRAGVHMHSNWMADQWVLSDLDTRDLLIAYEVCFLRRPGAAPIGVATSVRAGCSCGVSDVHLHICTAGRYVVFCFVDG